MTSFTMDKEKAIEILKTVNDPEIQIDVWTMGLIRKLDIKKNRVYILMTLTTPMCPYGEILIEEIRRKLNQIFKEVDIELTFDPPWEPSEELRSMLGV